MIKHKLIINETKRLDSANLTNFSLTERVNEGQDLTLGSVCSAMINFSVRIADGAYLPQYGDKIVLLESDGGNFTQHGVFYVETAKHTTDKVYTVTAYDSVSKLDKDITDWLKTVTFPIGLYNFISSAIRQCGLEIENASIPNGDYQIKGFTANGLTGRIACRWAGEISARFCRATADGKIVFDWYSPSSTSITANGENGTAKYFIDSFRRESFDTAKVEKVQIQFSKNDVGTVFPNSVGEKNTYIITGNYFLSAETPQTLLPIAEYIYNAIKDISYTPCNISIPSNFAIKAGETIQISGNDGLPKTVYLMSKVQSGSKDLLSCVGNKIRRTTTVVNSKNFSALSGKFLELETNVDGIKIAVSDIKSDTDRAISNLNVKADSITASVQSTNNRVDEAESEISSLTQKVNAQITSEQVRVEIETERKQAEENLKNTTGITLDENGVTVDKSGSSTKTNMSDNGLSVTESGTEVLTANKTGVDARNLRATTYLVVGGRIRFQNYGSDKVACFWIGG